MEHLSKLGRIQYATNENTLSAKEFIEIIEAHKEEIRPVSTHYIPITYVDRPIDEYGRYTITMLRLVNYTGRTPEERYMLLKYLFKELFSHDQCVDWALLKPYFDSKEEASCLLIAQHPSFFDIKIIFYYFDDNQELVEKIIGIADPHRFKHNYTSIDSLPYTILRQYMKDPIEVHKQMHIKHFCPQKACQVYVLILLIENKLLQIYSSSWSTCANLGNSKTSNGLITL